MSQINNLTGLDKSRPEQLQGNGNQSYFGQLELWIKQVYDNLTGVNEAKAFTVLELPDPASYDPETTGRAAYIYVSDETGGSTLAFSDGTNWRRVQDRVIVS